MCLYFLGFEVNSKTKLTFELLGAPFAAKNKTHYDVLMRIISCIVLIARILNISHSIIDLLLKCSLYFLHLHFLPFNHI